MARRLPTRCALAASKSIVRHARYGSTVSVSSAYFFADASRFSANSSFASADVTRPNCSDTLVLFDKKGVAYVIGSAFQFPTFAAGQGDFRIISSRDGGRTCACSFASVCAPRAAHDERYNA